MTITIAAARLRLALRITDDNRKNHATRCGLPWCVFGGAASRASQRPSSVGCGGHWPSSPPSSRPRPRTPRPSFGRPAAAPLQHRLAAPRRPWPSAAPIRQPLTGARGGGCSRRLSPPVATSAALHQARPRATVGVSRLRSCCGLHWSLRSLLVAYVPFRSGRGIQPARASSARRLPRRKKYSQQPQSAARPRKCPRQVAAMPRRRAFWHAEGFCALTRTYCLYPSPLPPPIVRGSGRARSPTHSHAPHRHKARSVRAPLLFAPLNRSAVLLRALYGSAPSKALAPLAPCSCSPRTPPCHAPAYALVRARCRSRAQLPTAHARASEHFCLPREFAPFGYGMF